MTFNEVHVVLPMHISWFSRVKLCVLEVHKFGHHVFYLDPCIMYI